MTRYHLGPAPLAAFYFVAAAAIALVVASTEDWARSVWRAMFLGWLVATALEFAVFLVFAFNPEIIVEAAVVCVAIGAVLGIPNGAIVWWRSKDE